MARIQTPALQGFRARLGERKILDLTLLGSITGALLVVSGCNNDVVMLPSKNTNNGDGQFIIGGTNRPSPRPRQQVEVENDGTDPTPAASPLTTFFYPMPILSQNAGLFTNLGHPSPNPSPIDYLAGLNNMDWGTAIMNIPVDEYCTYNTQVFKDFTDQKFFQKFCANQLRELLPSHLSSTSSQNFVYFSPNPGLTAEKKATVHWVDPVTKQGVFAATTQTNFVGAPIATGQFIAIGGKTGSTKHKFGFPYRVKAGLAPILLPVFGQSVSFKVGEREGSHLNLPIYQLDIYGRNLDRKTETDSSKKYIVLDTQPIQGLLKLSKIGRDALQGKFDVETQTAIQAAINTQTQTIIELTTQNLAKDKISPEIGDLLALTWDNNDNIKSCRLLKTSVGLTVYSIAKLDHCKAAIEAMSPETQRIPYLLQKIRLDTPNPGT